MVTIQNSMKIPMSNSHTHRLTPHSISVRGCLGTPPGFTSPIQNHTTTRTLGSQKLLKYYARRKSRFRKLTEKPCIPLTFLYSLRIPYQFIENPKTGAIETIRSPTIAESTCVAILACAQCGLPQRRRRRHDRKMCSLRSSSGNYS